MVYIIYTFGIKKSVSKYIFNMETVRDFIFLDFKITTDNGCSHEIERHLLLGRKAMTNLLLLLLLSRFSCVRLCATPWTAAYQASPSMGFSKQEHWSGLEFPSPDITINLPKFTEIKRFAKLTILQFKKKDLLRRADEDVEH